MLEWQVKAIKDLGKVVTGKTPSKENDEFYKDGELPFVSPKDLEWNSYYVYDTQTKVTEKAYDSQRNQRVPKDSVFYTSLSFAIGKIGIASRESLTNQQIHSIVVNDKHDYKFVYYLLQQYRPYIFCFNSGIDTPIVPKSVFEKINVVVPDLEVQKKIAAILSSYDDLIENNKKRIQILENMAEELYKEWFVRFRFPNYENTDFEKGVPATFKIKKISEVYKTASGGTPSRKVDEYFVGDINWFKTGELKSLYTFESEEKISDIAVEKSAAKLLPKDTVVIAMYCAMPDISILSQPSCINQACCAFLSKKEQISHIYTYYLIKNVQVELIKYAHGAAQQNLSQELIQNFSILIAPNELRNQFHNLLEPLFEQIKILNQQIFNLDRQKSDLLPRLISGKLSVEDLDIHFPPSMQE